MANYIKEFQNLRSWKFLVYKTLTKSSGEFRHVLLFFSRPQAWIFWTIFEFLGRYFQLLIFLGTLKKNTEIRLVNLIKKNLQDRQHGRHFLFYSF